MTFPHVSFPLFQTSIDSVSRFQSQATYQLIYGPEYLTGDRFSPEFMERRRLELVSVLRFRNTLIDSVLVCIGSWSE